MRICPEFYILSGTYFKAVGFISFYRFSNATSISPSIQIERSIISLGATACPRFTQAYTAFGFWYVIRPNGYLIIPGVFCLLRTIFPVLYIFN